MTLEELLNKLIKRGWKPFNVNCAWTNVEVMNRLREDNYYIPEHTKIIFKTENHYHVFDCNIRDLVSKSSGLWQFCCDKGLVEMYEGWYWQNIFPLDSKEYDYTDYQYWILESSLKDESELEKFLIENIKI